MVNSFDDSVYLRILQVSIRLKIYLNLRFWHVGVIILMASINNPIKLFQIRVALVLAWLLRLVCGIRCYEFSILPLVIECCLGLHHRPIRARRHGISRLKTYLLSDTALG